MFVLADTGRFYSTNDVVLEVQQNFTPSMYITYMFSIESK